MIIHLSLSQQHSALELSPAHALVYRLAQTSCEYTHTHTHTLKRTHKTTLSQQEKCKKRKVDTVALCQTILITLCLLPHRLITVSQRNCLKLILLWSKSYDLLSQISPYYYSLQEHNVNQTCFCYLVVHKLKKN